MSRYAFIDNIFGTDDDEETEANDAFDVEDDVVESFDASEGNEHEDAPVETDAMLAQLDRDFRKLRARVRASTDLSELRSIRADQTAALAGPLTPTTHLRTIDIIEAIDDRATDLRARRGRGD